MIQGTLLSWSLVAVSLFNTILLLWLGLTLWLNADHRSPGVVITAAGFLLGSALFVSHSALLLSETWQLTRSNTLWLALGSAPAALLPYVWYVVLLWYSGYWTEAGSPLRRRHRPWLWLVSAALAAGFACLVLLGLPFLPLLGRLPPWLWRAREFVKTPVMGVPWIAFAYPLYVLLCVVLSLDALRRPGLSDRLLGEAARERARPWLMVATGLLLLVGGLVAALVLWTITHTKVGGYYVLTRERLDVIGRFDLVVSILIAVVTILLGQAMTAYELFTGKVLPRRGLARQWKRAILLAGGYGALMGGALVWGMEPVYAILLTALLMTTFVAMLSWRSHVEWEQSMRQLRPFGQPALVRLSCRLALDRGASGSIPCPLRKPAGHDAGLPDPDWSHRGLCLSGELSPRLRRPDSRCRPAGRAAHEGGPADRPRGAGAVRRRHLGSAAVA